MDQMNYEAVQAVDTTVSVAAAQLQPQEQVQEVKPYTLRNLCSDDVFICVAILHKIGFKEVRGCITLDRLKAVVSKVQAESVENAEGAEDSDGIAEKAGFDIAMDLLSVIMGNMEACKGDVYKLLANLSGMTAEQISRLDAAVFVAMLIDVFKQKCFVDFFKVVLKFI